MGVLNVTPDSFSDGGRFLETRLAIDQGLAMVGEGAAIIDVGGESTRPGANPITEEEELRRILPVVERLQQQTGAIISVDTSRAKVIRAVAEAGATMINDVRALTQEGALEAAAATQCGLCLMHMKGEPRTMQQAPHYVDVVNEVKAFLQARVQSCLAAGVAAERLVIDPGFGFGKTMEHNLELLRRLRELTGERPVLAGLSRKSTVGQLTGRPPDQRVHGSVALALLAVLNGASIVRVHDVAATVDALRILAAVQG